MSRTNWRAKHDALQVELDKLRADAARVPELEYEIEELKKRVERAKLEGIAGVTGFLLREGSE